MSMVYAFAKLLFIPFHKIWLKKVSGLENIPKDKPFIIAPNHSSYYDALLPYTILIPLLNKQIHALVNSIYWDSPFYRMMVEWGKCIQVFVEKNTKSQRGNKESLNKAIDYLKNGDIIQVFPEGRRSYDGKLRRGYTGVAKLALKGKVPVVPMGIKGSNKILPKGKFFPRFKRCQVKIGKPMYFNKYYNKPITKQLLRTITDSIMKEIAKLIGRRYNP